jgi:L-methionine (R)-S-oxide reductase
MAESILIDQALSKAEKYELLLVQIRALIGTDTNQVSVLANCSAALHQGLGHFWTGFYLTQETGLSLGPFQGPVACMRIENERGVCGTSLAEKRTIIVPDVALFPGHIACSAESKSEIVVPVFNREKDVVAVLDIDSKFEASFDEVDQRYLEQFCSWLGEQIF